MDTTTPRSTFDPGQHLSKIKGQDYLEVKWRLAWLVSDAPSYALQTKLESHENGRAVVSASIDILSPDDPSVILRSATALGSVTQDDFENYIEKAETKAIGRALAALGYGTQFADDFSDDGAISDAPVSRGGQQSYQPRQGSGGNQGPSGIDAAATSAQKSMIQYKARQAKMEPEQLARFVKEETGKDFNELTKREASRVIDALGA